MVLAHRKMRESFGSFFSAYAPNHPYIWGPHTLAIIDLLQGILEDVEQGRSRYACIVVPPRHGKSDIASRRFPAWTLLRNPDFEVILASYADSLARIMSRSARACFRSAAPMYDLALSRDQNTVTHWATDKGGSMRVLGLGGGATGHGAHVLIIDDYLKNRQEAESEAIREKVWASFRNDLFTRLAPVHAVVIVANRWHVDDLVGRVLDEPKRDGDFPAFEVHRFAGWDKERGWLFPQRFTAKYYRTLKGVLGRYGWQSLVQGNPQARHGNLWRIDRCRFVTADEFPSDLLWCRGWDLASTMRQRTKDDPDYTVGVKIGWRMSPDGLPEVWVSDLIRGQWEAPERNRRIVDAGRSDGPSCIVQVEAVAGYKDAWKEVAALLNGVAAVNASQPRADLVARGASLEPVFEAGNVFVKTAPWNDDFVDELMAFPGGRHDDQAAALITAFEGLTVGADTYIGRL